MSSIIITITGPESSGKTTLARLLADHFGIDFIPEYARQYFSKQDHQSYSKTDFQKIAQEQVKRWNKFANLPFVIKDTDANVLKIWEQVKFHENSSWLEKIWQEEKSHLTFLCKPDFNWVADPLREHPHQRNWLFKIYLDTLNQKGSPYYILYGSIMSRFEKALRLINLYQ